MAVVELAERIARSRTTINVTWSLQRMQHGEQAHWMGVVLAAMSGSLGRPGGGYAGGLGISLMGVRPQWEPASGRVSGFEVLPLAHLARPRVDVTLRVSGFFRDAFPQLVALFDSAARAVQALDEAPDLNPAAARARPTRRRPRPRRRQRPIG